MGSATFCGINKKGIAREGGSSLRKEEKIEMPSRKGQAELHLMLGSNPSKLLSEAWRSLSEGVLGVEASPRTGTRTSDPKSLNRAKQSSSLVKIKKKQEIVPERRRTAFAFSI